MELVQTTHIDQRTIPPSIFEQLTREDTNKSQTRLSHFIANFYNFWFNPIIFSHAFMLIGTDARRLGVDLGDYLSSVCYFLKRQRPLYHIQLNQGGPDFRRRASENLGVGLASLFMVSRMDLRWETIAQIPANQKMSRLTPDFVGYTGTNERVIFESKGTTSLQTVEKTITKACEQVKSYPGSAKAKLAVASYFPGEVTTFNSFMFVADPPLIPLSIPERGVATSLHFLPVLDFIGAEKTKEVFAHYVRLEQMLHQPQPSEQIARLKERMTRQRKILKSIAHEEFVKLQRFEFQQQAYLGRKVTTIVGAYKMNLFVGCAESVLRPYIECEDIEFPKESQFEMLENEGVSRFTDGTLFNMRWFGEQAG